jgi:hypothetical protein
MVFETVEALLIIHKKPKVSAMYKYDAYISNSIFVVPIECSEKVFSTSQSDDFSPPLPIFGPKSA